MRSHAVVFDVCTLATTATTGADYKISTIMGFDKLESLALSEGEAALFHETLEKIRRQQEHEIIIVVVYRFLSEDGQPAFVERHVCNLIT